MVFFDSLSKGLGRGASGRAARRATGAKAAMSVKNTLEERDRGRRRLNISADHANNEMDLNREEARRDNLSQSATNTNRPVEHHRLQGHMDKEVARMGRGGDSRTRVLNNNNVARRMRDNDSINIDRPLG